MSKGRGSLATPPGLVRTCNGGSGGSEVGCLTTPEAWFAASPRRGRPPCGPTWRGVAQFIPALAVVGSSIITLGRGGGKSTLTGLLGLLVIAGGTLNRAGSVFGTWSSSPMTPSGLGDTSIIPALCPSSWESSQALGRGCICPSARNASGLRSASTLADRSAAVSAAAKM
jgi:hypothetical protein